MLQNIFHQFTMRINHSNPFTILNILNRHLRHQDRFTGTRFTNDVHMPPTISALNTHRCINAAIFHCTNNHTFLWHVWWWRRFFRNQPTNVWGVSNSKRQMPERCHFFCIQHIAPPLHKLTINKCINRPLINTWLTRNKLIPVFISRIL